MILNGCYILIKEILFLLHFGCIRGLDRIAKHILPQSLYSFVHDESKVLFMETTVMYSRSEVPESLTVPETSSHPL